MAPTPLFRTVFGSKVYQSSFLKMYWPFMMTGTFMFYSITAAHTALMNDPYDKWNNIMASTKKSGEETAELNKASDWYQEQLALRAAGKPNHLA